MIPWIITGGVCFVQGFWANEAMLRHDMRVMIQREIDDREAHYVRQFILAPDYYRAEPRV